MWGKKSVFIAILFAIALVGPPGWADESAVESEEPRKTEARVVWPGLEGRPHEQGFWHPPEMLDPKPKELGCPGPPGLERPRRGVDAILAHAPLLDLTEEQAKELKERRLETRLKAAALSAKREQAELKLEAALDRDEVDLQAVKELLHATAQVEAELRFLEIKLSVTAGDVLTPEQRERLARITAAPWRVVPPHQARDGGAHKPTAVRHPRPRRKGRSLRLGRGTACHCGACRGPNSTGRNAEAR
jgi:hypothetical protein